MDSLAACATQPALSGAAVDLLVAAASTQAERQLASDGRVDRFLVFLVADGRTSLGGILGGGDGPGGGDVLRAMMENGRFTAAADVSYPGAGSGPRVETMLVTCIDALGDEREVTVRLSRPAIRAWRSPR
jgi:hypothetical protein